HPGDPEAADTLAAIEAVSAGMAFEADVSDEAQVVAFFDAVETRFGAPDILVNNAGILREAPLTETRIEDFDQVIAVNLRGAFLAAREFARRTSTGRMINIASDLGLLGRPEMSAYTASKGGIIALTRTWARELAPGILVNAIAPGSIETDMTSPESMSPEQLAQDMDTPLARFGRPEDIAAMALHLAGPGGDFITGQVLGVNGGSAMQ
ncbi:MAG: SDR family oxidoreductase, partial [Thalassovita sp.]|nr:SDR family oxidoreductase [Thalassovita sp.]